LFAMAAGHAFSSTPAQVPVLPAPLLDISFDDLQHGNLPAGVSIRTQFQTPDVVPGVMGSAWRTDGFSSYAEAPLSVDPKVGFTLSLWVALESYPSDLEVPVFRLAPSSLARQSAVGAGFDLYVDTFGRWGFTVATTSGTIEVRVPHRFPLYQWTHVVAAADPAAGATYVYADGDLVATGRGKPGSAIKQALVPFMLAIPRVEAQILDFKVNRINAAYDQVAVYPGRLSAEQIRELPGPETNRKPDAEASLRVPESRFAGDFLRPRVHPIPPANWTNEPHGLVRRNEFWHLFYQRTPNGPYKTQMHWGHMASRDLVSWECLPDALWPELQTDESGFDMKGIWSGDVILDGDKAMAFYTSVNHGDRLAASNPGIATAVSEDPALVHWRKLGPILNSSQVRDFRDPFLWLEEGAWHMIIGAALESGGGLDYYILRSGPKGPRWEPQHRFCNLGYRLMDPGSVIWEMPVFHPLANNTYVLVVNPVGGRISKYGEPSTRAVYWTGEWKDGLFHPFFKDPKNLDLMPGHLAPTVARAADGQLRAIGIIDERRTPKAQLRAGWANTFSLPRIWSLMADHQTLGQAPAPELTSLRGEQRMGTAPMSIGPEPQLLAHDLRAYELLVDAAGLESAAGTLTIDLLSSDDGQEFTRLTFDPSGGRVVVDKSHSSLVADAEGPQVLNGAYDNSAYGPMRKIRIFVDGSTIEVFINDAAAYAVRSYPSRAASTGARISMRAGEPLRADVRLWPLSRPG
jgi:sucrose-6-phosphate hydrolase SacC (GH32 family)